MQRAEAVTHGGRLVLRCPQRESLALIRRDFSERDGSIRQEVYKDFLVEHSAAIQKLLFVRVVTPTASFEQLLKFDGF